MSDPRRGVSLVPSAEGQRAPYDVESEDEMRCALDESNAQARRLLADHACGPPQRVPCPGCGRATCPRPRGWSSLECDGSP